MTANALVADIGGTNIRLAIADLAELSLSHILTYQCADFANLEQAITRYQKDSGQSFDMACLDVACPVVGDEVNLTNNHWCFSQDKLIAQFNLSKLIVINDFTAIAMSVPFISEQQKHQIGGGQAQAFAPIAVYGAGTGLGVAHLVYTGEKWLPVAGEGGHVDFAAVDDDEITVLRELQKKYPRVSAEQVLSGLGLKQIYQSLCYSQDIQPEPYEPADISKLAITKQDTLAEKALSVFSRALGSFGGNLALNLATYGGVYIAGGIVPRFIDYIEQSDFRQRFEAKGRFTDFVENIPVYVVTAEQPGLIGCAAYLRQEL